MTKTFFCQACLEDKSMVVQSPDTRYCQGCCEFLLHEAELDKSWGKASWKPVLNYTDKPVEYKSHSEIPMVNGETHTGLLTRTKLPQNRALQKSALTPKISLMGRPKKEVPSDQIIELSKTLGVRDIARDLDLTPSMVSRVLSGRRK